MIALAIIGLTAVVILDQRLEVVRDAGRARDLRTAWVLASQKLAELELDRSLWTELGSQGNGDFGDVSPDYGAYTWEYRIAREQFDLFDPANPKSDKKPRELYRLSLMVKAPSVDDPILLEGEFPLEEPKPPQPAAETPPQTDAQNPPAAGTPQTPTPLPAAGARSK